MMLFVCFVNMHERKGEGGREERVGVSFLMLYYVFFQDKYFTEPCFRGESLGSGVNFITVLAITYHAYIGPNVAKNNVLLTNSPPALGNIFLHATPKYTP